LFSLSCRGAGRRRISISGNLGLSSIFNRLADYVRSGCGRSIVGSILSLCGDSGNRRRGILSGVVGDILRSGLLRSGNITGRLRRSVLSGILTSRLSVLGLDGSLNRRVGADSCRDSNSLCCYLGWVGAVCNIRSATGNSECLSLVEG